MKSQNEGSIFSRMLPPKKVLIKMISKWVQEDIPSFDVGAAVVGDERKKAKLYCKTVTYQEEGIEDFCGVVLAGVPFFEVILRDIFECEVNWIRKEGEVIKVSKDEKRVAVCVVEGKARNILQGERIALNVLTRCSAIATKAFHVQQMANKHGFKGEIAGTRKTTPGFRIVEKYALVVAGVSQHRFDVSSMIMLKDNHIDAMNGDIAACVACAKKLSGFSSKIEVECRSVADAEKAASCGADIVMLDNFGPEEMKIAAAQVKSKFPNVLIEVSGGLTPSNITPYFSPHIDILSMGCLIEGTKSVDFSLKIEKQ